MKKLEKQKDKSSKNAWELEVGGNQVARHIHSIYYSAE